MGLTSVVMCITLHYDKYYTIALTIRLRPQLLHQKLHIYYDTRLTKYTYN